MKREAFVAMTHRAARLTLLALLGTLPVAAGPPLVASLPVAAEPRQQGPPEEPFFAWSRMHFPAAEHAARRQRLARLLASEADAPVFVAVSGEGISSGETFRVAEDFLYLVGLELPNSALLVDGGSGRATLFVPRRDPRFDNPSRRNDFPGRTLLEDPHLSAESGIDELRDADQLEETLASLAEEGRPLMTNFGSAAEAPDLSLQPFLAWSGEQGFAAWLTTRWPDADVRNGYATMARLRMIKSPLEIEAMRRAAEITMAGIRHAATFVRDGVDERTLEGELEAEFKRRGAQRLPFSSIIKSGPNSLWPWRVLASHYDRRNRTMHDGELVIFDVGAERDYFVSDVGRTFPVAGSFTPEQRRILEMEVAVADAIIAAIRPGVTLRELQEIGVAAIPEADRTYMQAGLFYGHHLGLSTGDPNLPDAPLQPGMIFTVEPWYYNHDLGVAVFTEDEILVTEEGAENLTAALPRTPGELERMVARR